jgi:tetratricopeptide (TPR) repeat protein
MDYLAGLVSSLLDQWLQLPLSERCIVAMLVFGSPSVYLLETIRYWKLWKSRVDGNAVHLAPIVVSGNLLQKLGASGIALALRAELLAITETLTNLRSDQPVPYIAPATVRGTGYYIVGLRQEVPIPIQLEQQHIFRIKHEIVLRIGSVTLPVTTLMSTLVDLIGALPVYGRRRYKRSQVHVSLIGGGDQTLLTVHVPEHRPHREKSPTNRLRACYRTKTDQERPPHGKQAPQAARSVILSETRTTKTLSDLKDLIRDAAFMILHLHGSFGSRHWRSVRYLLDGLAALDQNRRTGRIDDRDTARNCFQLAAREDPLHNHEALYFHGMMTMVERTAQSIDEAQLFFEKGLGTDQKQLQSLVYAGLAYCHAQKVHRLGKLDPAVLEKAADYAELAEKTWNEYQDELLCKNADYKPRPHPLIPYTNAMVIMVNLSPEPDRNGRNRIERFWYAAELSRQAIDLEPDNGMFHNNMGWVLLKLAEWDEDILPDHVNVGAGENERRIALLAEKYLQRAIGMVPHNKLTHANLCLLYSTAWFRRAAKRQRYMNRCRHFGLKALQLDSNYINGHRDLAVALVRYGALDEAYCYYIRALRLAQDPDKKEEIISDILSELVNLEDRERWLARSRHTLTDWRRPEGRLLEPAPLDGVAKIRAVIESAPTWDRAKAAYRKLIENGIKIFN